MIKNLFYVALVVGIFFASSGVRAEQPWEKGVISLNISEAEDVTPDIAKITFAVETTEDTAQFATSQNNLISNKVISSLKALLDDGKDSVKTSNFSLRPNYVYVKNETRKIKNYTAYNSVVVETKDAQKIAKLIDAAISNGANRTDNLSYSFGNSSELCNELYPGMVKKLRTQADLIARAAGTSVSGIKFINASCNSASGYAPRVFYAKNTAEDAAGASMPSTPIEAGKVKVNVSVNAEFYVK